MCPESAVLKALMQHLLLRIADDVILDMEAGLEHIGRASARGVDAMIAVVEPGMRSVQTAARIRRLAKDIGIARTFVVANKIRRATRVGRAPAGARRADHSRRASLRRRNWPAPTSKVGRRARETACWAEAVEQIVRAVQEQIDPGGSWRRAAGPLPSTYQPTLTPFRGPSMDNANRLSADPATQEMIVLAEQSGFRTAWDRLESQQPQCGFGRLGICCRNCFMGPCRIDPFGGGAQEGICGATAETIVARNLLRNICSGTAAHSDHARDLVHALSLAAEGDVRGLQDQGPEPNSVGWRRNTASPRDGRSGRRSGQRRGPAAAGGIRPPGGRAGQHPPRPGAAAKELDGGRARPRGASTARWSPACTPPTWAATTTPNTSS